MAIGDTEAGGFDWGGMFGNLLTGAAGGALANSAIHGVEQFGQQSNALAQQVGDEARTDSAFKPFTVTSNIANTTTTPEGGVNIGLSGQQQNMQNTLFSQAGQAAGSIGGGIDPSVAGVGAQAGQLAGQTLGSAGQDSALNAQRSQLQSLFSQTLGQPTNMANAATTQAARDAAMGNFSGADVGGLGGMSNQFGSLTGQSMGALQGGSMTGNAAQLAMMRNLAPTSQGGLAGQSEQFGQATTDALGRLNQDQSAREQSLFNDIRATQAPDEERSRLQLEQRLQAQGRGGVRTSMFGGTPEQLAMEKAQAEARNSAALGARSQAATERQQALGEVQTMAGLTGSQAQQLSQLESAGVNRATALGQLGLSSEAQDLNRTSTLAGLTGNTAQQMSQLESMGVDRATALAGLGLQGTAQEQQAAQQQLQSALQVQGADQMTAQVQQALEAGDIGRATSLFEMARAGQAASGGVEAQDLQNLRMLQEAGFAPNQQALAELNQGTDVAGIADIGRRTGAQLGQQADLAGVEALIQSMQTAELGRQARDASAVSMVTGAGTGGDGLLGALGVGEDNATPQWIKDLGGIFGF